MKRTLLYVVGLCLLVASASQPQAPGDHSGGRSRADRLPDAAYIPTPHDVVEKMLELAGVGKDDVVYDLGCGDGRIVVAAAKKYGCRAVGFDIDPVRVEESRRNAIKNNVQDLVGIEQKDLFEVDLRGASVVTLYLGPRLNERLLPQLQRMKPGSRIVSHHFGIHGVKPDKIIRTRSNEDPHTHLIYLWTTPLTIRE